MHRPRCPAALFSLVLTASGCSDADGGRVPLSRTSAALKATGDSCTAGTECDSGFCVDSVCCTTACTGVCQACAAAKKQALALNGTCGPALEGLDPHDQCTPDVTGGCGESGACDGKGACALISQGVACTTDAGAGNTCVIQSSKGAICSGGGVCYFETSPAGIPCAPYACKGGACAFPCASDGDCQPPNRCESGVCKPKRKNGDPCGDKAECENGNCTDGVCCDTNCSGQCQACNVAGKVGTCSFTLGTPVAPRPDCAGSDSCKGTCNGGGDKCSYPGTATACSAASCTGDVSTSASTCDGTGTCAAGSTSPCTPYGCDATSGVCRKSCSSDGDCAAGGQCDTTTGKCAIAFATCKDPTTVQLPNGQSESCAPYVCNAGKCQQQCVKESDCAPGYSCQPPVCVAEVDAAAGGSPGVGGGVASGGVVASGGKAGSGSDSGDSGGCGCSVPARTSGGLTAFALAALGLFARRRRAG